MESIDELDEMSHFLKYNVLHYNVKMELINNIFTLLDCLHPQGYFMMSFPRNNGKSKSLGG